MGTIRDVDARIENDNSEQTLPDKICGGECPCRHSLKENPSGGKRSDSLTNLKTVPLKGIRLSDYVEIRQQALQWLSLPGFMLMDKEKK